MNLDRYWWIIAITISTLAAVIGFSIGSGGTEVIANIFAEVTK